MNQSQYDFSADELNHVAQRLVAYWYGELSHDKDFCLYQLLAGHIESFYSMKSSRARGRTWFTEMIRNTLQEFGKPKGIPEIYEVLNIIIGRKFKPHNDNEPLGVNVTGQGNFVLNTGRDANVNFGGSFEPTIKVPRPGGEPVKHSHSQMRILFDQVCKRRIIKKLFAYWDNQLDSDPEVDNYRWLSYQLQINPMGIDHFKWKPDFLYEILEIFFDFLIREDAHGNQVDDWARFKEIIFAASPSNKQKETPSRHTPPDTTSINHGADVETLILNIFAIETPIGYPISLQQQSRGSVSDFLLLPSSGSQEFLELVALIRTIFGPDHTFGEGLEIEGRHQSHRKTKGLTAGATLGNFLFERLFSGEVGKALQQSLGRLMTNNRRRLQIILSVNPDEKQAALVGNLPWELLYQNRHFFTLRSRISFIRRLNINVQTSHVSSGRKMQVIVVIADTRTMNELDFQREVESLRNAWSMTGVHLNFIRPTNVSALKEQLKKNPADILHFIGHGDEPGSSDGGITFYGDNGLGEFVSGRALAHALINFLPRLVVLNTCQKLRIGKMSPSGADHDLVSALLRVGLANALVMQAPITDSYAVDFCKHFYENLAENWTLDHALAEARSAMYLRDETRWEWVRPVLFIQSEQNDLEGELQESEKHFN